MLSLVPLVFLFVSATVYGLDIEARRVDFQMLQAQPIGANIQLRHLSLDPRFPVVDLELERFSVFAEDAKITVHGDQGSTEVRSPPNIATYRGKIRGNDASHAFIITDEKGDWRGIIGRADGVYVLEKSATRPNAQPLARRTQSRDFEGRNFQCGLDELNALQGVDAPHDHDHAPDFKMGFADLYKSIPELGAVTGNGVTYKVRVAIETDHEFFQLFNNTTAATNYIASLMGYLSTIYQNQVNTVLEVGDVSLWQTANDPWNQTGSTNCALYEFGLYWNTNRQNVNRTLVHFLSGKALGGGVAWLEGLCARPQIFNISNCPGLPAQGLFYGDYGLSADITGAFSPNNPQVIWDTSVVAHEIGHNFNSPHTHCYAGIGGNSLPVDGCYNRESDCYSGSESFPGPGSLTGGSPGGGTGSIMSYCHLLEGGNSNITLSFGHNFNFGVAPERVPQRMRAFVEQTAAQYPSCIVPATTTPPPPPPAQTGVALVEIYQVGSSGKISAISTRGIVQTGNDVLIGGFILEQTTTVAVRAKGPSMTAVTGRLADPTLELVYMASDQRVFNDDWNSDSQANALSAANLAPTSNPEAALFRTLAPGGYTGIVRGFQNATGIGLVEVYESGNSGKISAISTRALVETGDRVMIGGFVLAETTTVAIRAAGPSLPDSIANRLADPQLELVYAATSQRETNDNWRTDSRAAELANANQAPSNDLEAALLRTLPPGAYTVIVSGK